MRKTVLFFLVLGLVALPLAASAEMWIGGQVGGNFVANTDIDITGGGNRVTLDKVKIQPSVIGGLQIGYNFVKEGFLGYDYPDWMKYFSFAIDFTYNRLDINTQEVSGTFNGVPFARLRIPKIEGYAATLGFLFIGKYGFLPDSEVPFGRLVPYVGVGPAILFSGINGMGVEKSSADICLLVETGVKYFALKNVSLDLAFRYRYAQPSYGVTFAGVGQDIDIDAAHQFNFLFRANYHF